MTDWTTIAIPVAILLSFLLGNWLGKMEGKDQAICKKHNTPFPCAFCDAELNT